MTNSQRQAKARNCFLQWIEEQLAADHSDGENQNTVANSKIIREGMVIREDFFLGRRFVTQTWDAIWFIEEDQLKIFNTHGSVLQVMNRSEIDQRAETYEQKFETQVNEKPFKEVANTYRIQDVAQRNFDDASDRKAA